MDYDLIVRNGVCYTGDGSEGEIRDIGIKDGTIAAIGRLDGAAAKKIIEAERMAVAPGFVDTHSHSDLVALFDPAITNKTAQGVTTDIIGQDGMSLAPIVPEYLESWKKSMAGLEGQYEVEWDWNSSAEYLDRLSRQKLGPNIAYLVPFGNVRLCVVGLGIREAADAEIRRMADLTEAGIEA
jgi:N-acyl-D-amino-acid deacylase